MFDLETTTFSIFQKISSSIDNKIGFLELHIFVLGVVGDVL
jgi:hypothetical protein